MTTAAVYIRVSTDEQLGNSPESQHEEIKRYAAANGYEIIPEYVFSEREGASGRSTASRPEFRRMIQAAKEKPRPFDAVLVWKFSRFARNREDSIVYKRMLRKQCGVEVISVGEKLGTEGGALGEMVEAIIETMDEYFSVNLAEEVRRGMLNTARNGKFQGSPPLGYRAENGGLVIDGERAETVREIFNMFVGGATYREIVERLAENGVKGTKGKAFEIMSICHIIRNPVYVGRVVFRPSKASGEPAIDVPGKHEPIIDEQTYAAAQARIKSVERMYKPRAKRNAEVKRVLMGLVVCSSCGKTLTNSRNGYQCGGYNRGQCRISHFCTADKLETAVFDALSREMAHYEELHIVPREPKPQKDTTNAVAKLKAREKRIKLGYDNGVYTLGETKEKLAEIRGEIERLNAAPVVDTTDRRAEIIAEFKSGKDILTSPAVSIAEKNAFLRGFIDKIVYDKSAETLDIFFF